METKEDVVGQYYDPSKNQMPYGGATDINGKIVWVITKERHDEIFDRLKRLFPECFFFDSQAIDLGC
jgi:hypothetical protein